MPKKVKITIAIDGHSSTGKSTVARQLAKELGYIYVDTGAMYRAVTLYAIRENLVQPDGSVKRPELKDRLSTLRLSFILNQETGIADMYLNGENVEREIRTLEVSSLVSVVAAIPEVRKLLVAQQQEMGREKGVVMDGRDIGTVVFPEAELKLFMTAAPEIRGERRYAELRERGEQVNKEEVISNVLKRDEMDTNREDSPLVKAADAVVFDNSHLDINTQFEKIKELALKAIQRSAEC